MKTRIEPREDGLELAPPSGGSWVRDPDGGLSPADAATAVAAGLDWPEQPHDADGVDIEKE